MNQSSSGVRLVDLYRVINYSDVFNVSLVTRGPRFDDFRASRLFFKTKSFELGLATEQRPSALQCCPFLRLPLHNDECAPLCAYNHGNEVKQMAYITSGAVCPGEKRRDDLRDSIQ